MKRKLITVQKFIDNLMNIFAIALFMSIFFVVLLQVFMRFVLNSPLVWSEEFARYSFIWVSLIGWAFAARNGSHIRISIITDKFPKAIQKVLRIFHYLLTVVFSAVFFYYGIIMVRQNLGVSTITLFFTYAVVYFAVPVSTILLVFYTTLRLITDTAEVGGTLS
jgi:TRAP-type C4-dicarboxylate transport system permease small subunit